MSTRTVSIIQEYVPAYRVPLFEAMKSRAASRDINLLICAGSANATQAARNDSGVFELDRTLRQKEFTLFGRRLVLRDAWPLYRRSDLVIIEQARRNIDAYLALLRYGHRTALWGHGRDYTVRSGRLRQALQRWLTLRSSWFFGYTPESVTYVGAWGYPFSRTTTLWNTTDTSALRKHLATVEAGEVAKARRGSQYMGLFVGGLDASKHLDLLVSAGDQISSALPEFSLVVIGDGPDRACLETAAQSRSWLRVEGPRAGRELSVFLAAADLMLMPGRVGLVAVDCLVAGLPVVTTDWELHAPERAYLNDETCRVSAMNATDFATCAINVFLDTPGRLEMSRAAREDSSKFTIEKMADRFLDGIERALNAHPS